MTPCIEIKNLTKQFGTSLALKKLNLSVPQGRSFALLGPNGAGKTTTIKTVMNIIPPTSGETFVFGINSTRLGSNEFSDIGYISENQQIPQWMTVGQFLSYCKNMYPKWDDDYCNTLLARFALPVKGRIKSLSRGMRMKTLLISTLSYHPGLIIFDEPFSGLDTLVREEFISAILEESQKLNRTFLISSHDIDEVERLADWIGIIDKGEIRLIEEAKSLIQRFCRITVTLSDNRSIKKQLPASWLFPEKKGNTYSFIDSQYVKGVTEQSVGIHFPCLDTTFENISLREIFYTFARQFKIEGV